jgi:hypothetical protein
MDIKLFWNDIITQNRGSLSSYFCKDAVIRWHCTNEQFTVEEYVQANCDYPGRWQGEIERIEEFDSQVIFVGRVQSEDAKISCHVTSFIKMKNDLIVEMDEYWFDDGEAPVWRRELGIGKAIR